MENNAIHPGRYRHYKGKTYQVLAIAAHSETLEPMVVYQALYGDHKIWVRPASMWNELVSCNGVTTPRFAPIQEPDDSVDAAEDKSLPPIRMDVYRQLIFDAAMDLAYGVEPQDIIIQKLISLADRPIVNSEKQVF